MSYDLDRSTKEAYSKFVFEYALYADGDSRKDLYAFLGRQFAHSDKRLWECLLVILGEEAGRCGGRLRVLDVGCGPGTWLLRLVDTLEGRGLRVQGTGIDRSEAMVSEARRRVGRYRQRNPRRKVDLEFVVGDVSAGLPFGEKEFDLVLCLYTVLNHLEVARLSQAVGALHRVCKGSVVASVRAAGGLPTVYVCNLSDVVSYRQNGDELEFTHQDGYRGRLRSHLFTPRELVLLFQATGEVDDCFGLDIFLSRFAAPSAWEPRVVSQRGGHVEPELEILEERCCRAEPWIDRANHIVIVSRARGSQGCASVAEAVSSRSR